MQLERTVLVIVECWPGVRAILFLAAFADLLTCERSSKVILTMSERLTLA